MPKQVPFQVALAVIGVRELEFRQRQAHRVHGEVAAKRRLGKAQVQMSFDKKATMPFPDLVLGSRKGEVQVKTFRRQVHDAERLADEIRPSKVRKDPEQNVLPDVVNLHVEIPGILSEHRIADKASDQVAFSARGTDTLRDSHQAIRNFASNFFQVHGETCRESAREESLWDSSYIS